MQCLGNPEVLTNIIRKQRALTMGSDLPKIRPASIALAGGLAGVEGAGYFKALYQFAPDAFDVCAGISAGAPNTYAFLVGMPNLALNVYEHLVTTDFLEVDVWHMRMRMKIDYVTKILREGFDGFVPDQQKIYNHRSKFVVFGTEYSTGNGFEIDTKKVHPDIVEGVCASMMAPGVCSGVMASGLRSGVVRIGDKDVVDGACGIPFPVRNIIKKYRPTDILILFNRPLPEHLGLLEWVFFPMISRFFLWLQGVPRPVRDRTASIDRVMIEEIRALRNRKWKKVRWCIVAPEPHEHIIHPWSTDAAAIRQTGIRSYAGMYKLLQEHSPKE